MDVDYATLWSAKWDETLTQELENERRGHYEPEQFYTSGRTSKEFPNKEDKSWWTKKGPDFVKSWVNWRNASELKIWTAPDGRPGIELEVWARQGNLEIQSHIDRVMEDAAGNLYIIDLKSGSQTPAWPQQLALNNLGLLCEYGGLQASYGGFWSARKGALDPGWFDLRVYTPEWLFDQARMAREIRDRQLFVAHPTMLCKTACGVRDFCVAVAGPLSYVHDVTLTQNRK